jgi:hypothetical protein
LFGWPGRLVAFRSKMVVSAFHFPQCRSPGMSPPFLFESFVRRIFWFLAVCCLALTNQLAAQSQKKSFFGQEARTYLYARAKSSEHENIVGRILELDLSEKEAKDVVSRIPFLSQTEKMEVFRMLDDERKLRLRLEAPSQPDSPRGLLPLGDDGERRLILKRFVLGKVRSEAQYQSLMKIFSSEEPVLHSYERIVDLGFLKQVDIELARRISEGKLEAYYDRRMGRSFRYSQEVEASSVRTTGFDVDALKEEGEFGRIRHRFRGFHLPGATDFYGELVIDGGDQSLRVDDRAQLEYMALEWRGQNSRFFLGDSFVDGSEILLDRELRGLVHQNRTWLGSHFSTDLYVGAVLLPIETLFGMETDTLAVSGVKVEKKLGNERSVSIGYQVARELDASRGRESRLLSFGHDALLAENLRLSTEVLSSYGDRTRDLYQSSFAADLRLDYKYRGDLAFLHYSRFGKDFFSPSGLDLEDTTQWQGRFSFAENWGEWDVEGHWMSNSSDPTQSALDVLRPSFGLHLNSILGRQGLHGFYRYYESQEDATDLSRLFVSRTHWTRVLKSGSSGQLEAWYRHRYQRDRALSPGSDLETQWNISARGYYLWFGQDLSPEIFYSEERKTDLLGLRDLRRQGGAQLSFSILGSNRAFARYTAWRSQATAAQKSSRGKILDLKLALPISSNGGKKINLSYKWEEQDLADSLSFSAYREARIAYENLF